MKIAVTFFLLVFLAFTTYAEVEIPEFSFNGKDVSSFSASPAFSSVKPDYKAVSGYETYIKKEFARLSADEGKKYSAEDPGGLYNSTFGTSISYIFVGHRAYRNNIVKNYLGKNYTGVVNSYREYQEKLYQSEYASEVKLLYALSLLESGGMKDGEAVLKEMLKTSGKFSDLAADSLFNFYERKKDWDGIIETTENYGISTSYQMYSYVHVLLEKGGNKKIIDAFKKYSSVVEKDKSLYSYLIAAAYYTGEYKTVAEYAAYADKVTMPMLADSYLHLGENKNAESIISGFGDGEDKYLLTAKLNCAKKDIKSASKNIEKLTRDSDKLNLLFFYIEKNFPDISSDFLNHISFSNSRNNDYINYYLGLKNLMDGDEKEASKFFGIVSYEPKLITLSYFYRGLTFSQRDRRLSEFYLLKYLEDGLESDKQKISRFMLAQFRYIEGKKDDALMLLSGCSENFCKTLKAEIAVSENQNDEAVEIIKGVKSDRASYVRANAFFNIKNYEKAKTELESAKRGRDAELLLMKTYFKLSIKDKADAIYFKYQADKDFLVTIVDNYFLSGDYDKVVALLQRIKNPDDYLMLIKAKALSSKKEWIISEEIFKNLISANKYLYESYFGYLNQLAAQGRNNDFKVVAQEFASREEAFDKIDLLYIDSARLAIDMKDYFTATILLNGFFNRFKVTEYRTEAFLMRGRLFRDTDRTKQCVMEADRMIGEKRAVTDAYLLKAECLEKDSPKDAVDSYRKLAEISNEYKELSFGRLMLISPEPKDVLEAGNYFKEKDKEQYVKSVRRYFSMLSTEQLIMNRALITEALNDVNPFMKCAGIYYEGIIAYNTEKYFDSVQYFMKVFYLFDKDELAYDAALKAAEAYKKLGKKEEAAKMFKAAKKLKN